MQISDRNIAKLRINNPDVSNVSNLLGLRNADGVHALECGGIDAVILVDGFNSPNVQRLIKNSDIKLSFYKKVPQP